jgi:hypothetical protein
VVCKRFRFCDLFKIFQILTQLSQAHLISDPPAKVPSMMLSQISLSLELTTETPLHKYYGVVLVVLVVLLALVALPVVVLLLASSTSSATSTNTSSLIVGTSNFLFFQASASESRASALVC